MCNRQAYKGNKFGNEGFLLRFKVKAPSFSKIYKNAQLALSTGYITIPRYIDRYSN